jgi:hypothetical protein
VTAAAQLREWADRPERSETLWDGEAHVRWVNVRQTQLAALADEVERLEDKLDQALYGPRDEQARLGRICARCIAHLDDGEKHTQTCPYAALVLSALRFPEQ